MSYSVDLWNCYNKLENQLVELVYKNKDRLDDELDFIKEYFNI